QPAVALGQALDRRHAAPLVEPRRQLGPERHRDRDPLEQARQQVGQGEAEALADGASRDAGGHQVTAAPATPRTRRTSWYAANPAISSVSTRRPVRDARARPA